MEDLEERVRTLESSISFYKGAFAVGVVAFLAFAGTTSFVLLPAAAKTAIENQITPQTKNLLNKALETARALQSGAAKSYPTLIAKGDRQEIVLRKHSFCAITRYEFNFAKGGTTKICRLSQNEDRAWLLEAIAEPGQVLVCQASCIPN